VIDLDRLFDISGADTITFEPHDADSGDHVVHFEYWRGISKTNTVITVCDCDGPSAEYAARVAKRSAGETPEVPKMGRIERSARAVVKCYREACDDAPKVCGHVDCPQFRHADASCGHELHPSGFIGYGSTLWVHLGELEKALGS
jgi:hypothetical protein